MQNFFQKIQPYLKYLKYLYVPSIFLVVAGAIAGITSGVWSSLYLGLIIAGAIFFLAWLVWLVIKIPNFLTRRSTQAGSNVLLGTVALLIIVGLINFLAFRFLGKIDLTENQLFTLSPQTQEIITNLKQPIKLWIFDSDPNPSDKALLDNFRRYNSNFSFEFINPDQKPGLVKKFQVKAQGDVYLESGTKKQLVQTLINFNQREPLSEIKLTNAIEKIQRDRVLNVYFLQGHGEHPLNTAKEGMSEAVNNLENKGFKVNPLNLVETSAIPEETNAIIIAGPKRKLFAPEVDVLQKYADQGGNLLVMVDPETEPGLEPLFKQWGVQLDPRIIVDVSGAGNLIGLGPAAPIITKYGEHPITKEFSNGISIFPLSRPVSTIKKPNVQAVTILEASDKMWAKKDLTSEELVFDPKQDLKGPFDLGVALTRTEDASQKILPFSSPSPSVTPNSSPTIKSLASPSSSSPITATPNLKSSPTISPKPQASTAIPPSPSPSIAQPSSVSPSPNNSNSQLSSNPSSTSAKKTEKIISKMVVIGNSSFAINQWFGEQLNGDVFLNSVQWLAADDEQSLSIRPKEPKKRRIILNGLQASLISWLSLIIFPLFGLGLAIFTGWRRR